MRLWRLQWLRRRGGSTHERAGLRWRRRIVPVGVGPGLQGVFRSLFDPALSFHIQLFGVLTLKNAIVDLVVTFLDLKANS